MRIFNKWTQQIPDEETNIKLWPQHKNGHFIFWIKFEKKNFYNIWVLRCFVLLFVILFPRVYMVDHLQPCTTQGCGKGFAKNFCYFLWSSKILRLTFMTNLTLFQTNKYNAFKSIIGFEILNISQWNP